jgi:hypothetical protein
MTELLIASVQVSADYCALFQQTFFQQTAHADRFPSSQCAETPSLYIREQVMTGSLFMHGMSPAGRTGRSPKKWLKVKIVKCLSAALDAAWRKERTYLLPDSTMERRYIDGPQSELTREYFRTVKSVDVHNQYRHGIPAMERPCKTKSWNLRLFQTVMGKVLVNGFLAFKFKTSQSQSLSNLTNVGGAGVVRRRGGGGRRWCHGQDQSSKAVKNFEKRGGTTFGEDQTCPGQRDIYWCGRQTEAGAMQHVQGASRNWSVRNLRERTGY